MDHGKSFDLTMTTEEPTVQINSNTTGSESENTGMDRSEQWSALVALARQQTSLLKTTIEHRHSHAIWGDSDFEALFWTLYRGRNQGHALVTALEEALANNNKEEQDVSSSSPSEVVAELQEIMEQALEIQQGMEKRIFEDQKDKSFKRHVAHSIAMGQGPEWMTNLFTDEIEREGGNSNRLYQLLLEHATPGSIAPDAATLTKAANRWDLFSDKQRENLTLRAEAKAAEEEQEVKDKMESLQKKDDGETNDTETLAKDTSVEKTAETPAVVEYPPGPWTCASCACLNQNTTGICDKCHDQRKLPSFVEVAKKSPSETGAGEKAIPSTATSSKRIKKNYNGFSLWILNEDVPEFIGPSGRNAKELKRRTGLSYLSADQSKIENGWCPIVMKGTTAAIRKCTEIVERKYGREKPEATQRPLSQLRTTKTIYIDNYHIPKMIGYRGVDVHAMVNETGVDSIFANQSKLNEHGECPVAVTGPADNVEVACAKILEKYGEHHPIESNLPEEDQRNYNVPYIRKTVWILNTDVPDLIGPGGCEIRTMIQRTGVQSITAWQNSLSSDGLLCPIEIKGYPDRVEQAAYEIVQEYQGLYDLPGAEAEEDSTPNEPMQPLEQTTTNSTPTPSEKELDTVPSLDSTNSTPTTSHTAAASESKETGVSKSEHPVTLQRPTTTEIKKEAEVIKEKESTVPTAPLQSETSASVCSGASSSMIRPVKEIEFDRATSVEAFLRLHGKFFECNVSSFASWLETVGITSLMDLVEALDEKDFVLEEMKPNGLKYYKRIALKKAALDRIKEDKTRRSGSMVPSELICPLLLELMLRDPVVAADGFTYERESIEQWIAKARRDGEEILSPVTNKPLEDLSLTQNLVLHGMAKDFARRHPGVLR